LERPAKKPSWPSMGPGRPPARRSIPGSCSGRVPTPAAACRSFPPDRPGWRASRCQRAAGRPRRRWRGSCCWGDGQEVRLELLILGQVDGPHPVVQPHLLQHDRRLAAVGSCGGVEGDHRGSWAMQLCKWWAGAPVPTASARKTWRRAEGASLPDALHRTPRRPRHRRTRPLVAFDTTSRAPTWS